MRITKIGHCCLRIEINGTVVLTDPGKFTEANNEQTGVDVIVITHEHGDHMHVPSVQALMTLNPGVTVMSNGAVASLLRKEHVPVTILEGQSALSVAGVRFEACDGDHAEIFEEIGQVQNTGYFIGERLFYPGDSYAEPGKAVEVLALPVGGPWCRMTDTLHYAIRVAPKQAFPVHDAIEREDRLAVSHGLATEVLKERGIVFTPLLAGETLEV